MVNQRTIRRAEEAWGKREIVNKDLKDPAIFENDEYYDDDDYEDEDEDEEIIQSESEDIDIVVEATTKTSEEVHGGDEATGDIEDSPNAKLDGEDEKDSVSSSGGGGKDGNGGKKEGGSIALDDFLDRVVTLVRDDEVVTTIRRIAARERSLSEKVASGKYDEKLIAKHLLYRCAYKVPVDFKKIPAKAKKAAFFIDLSGSFSGMVPVIKEAVRQTSREGFSLTVYDCGNGFNCDESTFYDPYNSRNRLAKIISGTPAALDEKITTPSIEDAIKICNNIDFSIVFTDFDAFSTVAEVSYGCRFDKIPYLFDFETRYDDPEEHDWNYAPFYDYCDQNKWLCFRDYAERLEELLWDEWQS